MLNSLENKAKPHGGNPLGAKDMTVPDTYRRDTIETGS